MNTKSTPVSGFRCKNRRDQANLEKEEIKHLEKVEIREKYHVHFRGEEPYAELDRKETKPEDEERGHVASFSLEKEDERQHVDDDDQGDIEPVEVVVRVAEIESHNLTHPRSPPQAHFSVKIFAAFCNTIFYTS